MKNFITKILALFIFLLVISIILDFFYSSLYRMLKPQTKPQWALSMTNQDIDNLFLGSSRTENHINANLFEELSGESAFNFGQPTAGFEENKLLLEILLANDNKIKNVYLQIDHLNYENTEDKKIARVQYYPFIWSNSLINTYLSENEDEYYLYKYLPFYKYLFNDARLGIRGILISIVKNKNAFEENKGYYSIDAKPKATMGKILPPTIRSSSKGLEKFKEVCEKNEIKLTLFLTPVCSMAKNKIYFSKLVKKIPSILDLSYIQSDSLFYNCGHLNSKGAELLTSELYNQVSKE
jgi:hypothetical protein